MKIFLGTDHTGIEYKNAVSDFLKKEGHDVIDCGAYVYDKHDDYPDFIGKAAASVSTNTGSLGFIFGGSGQGEQMTANKYKGVRCALFYTSAVPSAAVDISGKESNDPFEIIMLTRQHNHANMLSLAVRFLSKEDVLKAVALFLATPISHEERHVRRVDKIKAIEA